MKTASQFLSVIGHPLLILTYGLLLMLISNPFLFGAASIKGYIPFISIVLFSTFLIPAVAVALMRGLNMIQSFEMEERKERVGPLFATCILYSAFYFNVRQSNTMPEPFANFLLGALISLFCCLFINSFYKISLHAVGLSGLAMGMLVYYFSGSSEAIMLNMGEQVVSIHFVLIPIFLIVFAGLVSSCRLILNAHNLDEILAGWMVGVLGQIVVLFF